MEEYTKLVELARRGDKKAFSALYETIYQDMYRFALYTLKNTHDAEDVVSDAVLDAYTGIHGLRNSEAFKSWIFRILTNKCKQKLKQYIRKTIELPEDILETSFDYDEAMDIRQAFSGLSSQERLILGLNLFGGYTSSEIGKTLFLSPGTVRSKQSRALKKLEKTLSV